MTNEMNPGELTLNPSSEKERKFSRAKPLAKRIGLSTKSLFRWADAGHIHRHKINDRVVLFDEAEVTAFIESARVA